MKVFVSFGFWIGMLGLVGCTSTAPLIESVSDDGRKSMEEVCDGRDNDLDGEVDEEFRDTRGVYFTAQHCGSCNRACSPDDHSVAMTCEVDDSGARCVASECVSGYEIDEDGDCVPRFGWLCAACTTTSQCGRFESAGCFWIGGEQRCSFACQEDSDCPSGYACSGEELCAPKQGSCRCGPGDTFEMACSHTLEGGQVCPGVQRCEDGVLAPCTVAEEICDGLDNDCNGVVDDPFLGPLGTYNLDPRHCGGCGVDCTTGPQPEYAVTCGGPVTSPVCALLCPDSADGITTGDALDADLNPSNGCECTVNNADDQPEATRGGDAIVDENCDGADGIAQSSYYVAPWGTTGATGSPIQPLSSIAEAVASAAASLTTLFPRPDIYVAAGTYEETLLLQDLEGLRILGGYRPDFLYRNATAYPTVLSAPAYDTAGAVAGAALVVRSCGKKENVLFEGFALRGASAPGPLLPAIGAFVSDGGRRLTLRGLVVHSGDAGSGFRGAHGEAGPSPSSPGGDGDQPRAAVEGSNHNCIASSANSVTGGGGSSFSCGGIATNGGSGGSSSCPEGDGSTQASGSSGSGSPSGSGGDGGSDCRGPIDFTSGCPGYLCCGLADFLVPSQYEVAQDGSAGGNGSAGSGGLGCTDARGTLTIAGAWSGALGASGTFGSPGAGGGGGGGGGGARIDWYAYDCEFADGLGGGGGGGGAGGCGGSGGTSGTSGAPSIGFVVVSGSGAGAVTIEDCQIHTGSGGRGGEGGNGGLPGKGSPGGEGGALEPQQQITPTLAGTSSGGHGGQGGDGGGGGGGGGGCGGAVVGIWTLGISQSIAQAYDAANEFSLGTAGGAGNGGSGSRNGRPGTEGRMQNVVAQ
jgi:hypothetical protein